MKFLRAPFSQNTSGRLPLMKTIFYNNYFYLLSIVCFLKRAVAMISKAKTTTNSLVALYSKWLIDKGTQ